MADTAIRLLAENRKARHNFELNDRFEAGLSLLGTEVKSLRGGKGNIAEAWVQLKRNGAWLMGAHIAHYTEAHQFNHEPTRPRQLLLHAHELQKLRKATHVKGHTIVPIKLYIKGSLIKLEIAIGKGRKSHDKRHALKAKDAKREMDRAR
jgi:SsrA-binding protein